MRDDSAHLDDTSFVCSSLCFIFKRIKRETLSKSKEAEKLGSMFLNIVSNMEVFPSGAEQSGYFAHRSFLLTDESEA